MRLSKGSPTTKLLVINTEKSVPSPWPNLPACVCRTPCSLQHPQTWLFQKTSIWVPTTTVILCNLSPDNTAGTLALCLSRHSCHQQERERQSFTADTYLMKEHLLKRLPAIHLPTPLAQTDQQELPGLRPVWEAPSYTLDTN